MKNEDIKLIKTESGTDWEAYQVIKTDTARWIDDEQCLFINEHNEMMSNYCPLCGRMLK